MKSKSVKTEGPESGYRKVKAKKLPAGYDKGEFGEHGSYDDFGGSGFKKGKDWKYGPRGKETKIDQDIPSELDTDKKETGYEKMDEFNLNLGLAKGEYGDDVKGKVGYSIKIQNDDKLQSMSTSTFADLSKAKEFVKKNLKRIITTNIIPDLSKPEKVKSIDPKKLLRIKENRYMKKTELKQIIKEEFDNVMKEMELQKEQEQLDAKKVLAGIKKFQKMFGTKAPLSVRKYGGNIGTLAIVALPAGTEKGSPEQTKKHKEMQKAIKALKLPISSLDSVKGQATFWVQYGVDESVNEGFSDGTDSFKDGVKDTAEQLGYTMVGEVEDANTTLDEKKSTDWEVTYDNNNIRGKKIKKGTTVKVKARNSEEAHKKAAKKLGLGDSYMALKGRAKRLGESVNEDRESKIKKATLKALEAWYDTKKTSPSLFDLQKISNIKMSRVQSAIKNNKTAKDALKAIFEGIDLNESVNETQKENVGNLFIVKDDNGHIHLEIGGRSGQMNLGYVGGKKLKEFLSKLIKLSKK